MTIVMVGEKHGTADDHEMFADICIDALPQQLFMGPLMLTS